jgi:hypothetical protein
MCAEGHVGQEGAGGRIPPRHKQVPPGAAVVHVRLHLGQGGAGGCGGVQPPRHKQVPPGAAVVHVRRNRMLRCAGAPRYAVT